MILLADSGSTKTDWRLLATPDSAQQVISDGINPYFEDSEQIITKLRQQLIPSIDPESVSRIFYYGTGCNSPASCGTVETALRTLFPGLTAVEVASDMVGAARGAAGQEQGIVCILGTGSNACCYDGHEIVRWGQPLGFWLGDEGSGGYLGKTLVRDAFQHRMPAGLREVFDRQYQLDRATLLENAYRKPFPNRYFAAFTPFLSEHLTHPYVQQLVRQAFRDFLTIYVKPFPEAADWPVHFVGSIAWYFAEILRDEVTGNSCRMGDILKAPGDGLVRYHRQISSRNG
ncbi:N-acetylglucosamine kinase [Arsenicibacter rosenii]|uniref:N-acetylglucosamine kinase n=1 Tax=Arsenicibacter rosenii TaxID=1750698 RepID=A0A1S2VL09_9BACT|nr:N-acetylglucosamine kinase [Arsenicibacter rosenii]OIN58886.1 N-acetylglucosamine kinase [Arsenicibacter rosenii]